MSFLEPERAAALAAVLAWLLGSGVAEASIRSHTVHGGYGRLYLPIVAAALLALA
jgi:hypothetical protein